MNEKIFKRRVFLSGLIIIIITVFIIIRLFTLHFSNKIIIAEDRTGIIKRGYIKDRNGYILALSIETHSLFANPEIIKDPHAAAVSLSKIIRMPVLKIKKKLLAEKKFIWLKRKISESQKVEIGKLKIDGLYFIREYKRLYPHGNLASNIIGFVGLDNLGLDGIEYHYNSILSPETKSIWNKGDFEIGMTVVLTIDAFIQYVSEKAIRNAVQKNRAKQGSIVVLEVKTGRILAVSKYPNFNPNYYYRFSKSYAKKLFYH